MEAKLKSRVRSYAFNDMKRSTHGGKVPKKIVRGERPKPPKKVTGRTSAGLCGALFEEFDALRNGESDAHKASAIAKIAIQIIAIKRLELDAAALLRGSGQRVRHFQTPSLQLAP